jgi:hypothetical protein
MSSLSFDTISPTVSTQTQNVLIGPESKDSYERLHSPINRTAIRLTLFPSLSTCQWLICLPLAGLYYMNAYGHEMHPVPTPEYISGLGSSQVLVYSCGSLWTRFVFTTLSCPPTTLSSGHEIASFPALPCAEWRWPSRVLVPCARKSFSVSSRRTSRCRHSRRTTCQ